MSDGTTRETPDSVVQLAQAKVRLRPAPASPHQAGAPQWSGGRPSAPGAQINGVNVAEMKVLLDAALAAPDGARATWRVVTTWEPGPQGAWGHTHTCYDVDEMGEDHGDPTPQEQLLGVANACVILGLRIRAAREGFRLDAIEVTARADSALRELVGLPTGSPGFSVLDIQVATRGEGCPARREELAREVLAASPILACLRRPVDVVSSVIT